MCRMSLLTRILRPTKAGGGRYPMGETVNQPFQLSFKNRVEKLSFRDRGSPAIAPERADWRSTSPILGEDTQAFGDWRRGLRRESCGEPPCGRTTGAKTGM